MTIPSLNIARGLKNWAKGTGLFEDQYNALVTEHNALALSGTPSVPDAYGVDIRTLSGNVTFTTLSTLTIIDTASSSGFVLTLGDATAEATMYAGQHYHWINDSPNAVTINDNGGTRITYLGAGQWAQLHLEDDTTAAGTWKVWDAEQRDIQASIATGLFI